MAIMSEEDTKAEEKILPKKNCVLFWKAMLFNSKAFLPIETVVIIEATIKHLKENDEI